MIKKELISVIVPIYNVEKYLPKCIESIMNQTYQNLEIILVDDGSLDNCGTICDEYCAIDQRIKVIHQNNKGLSSARNAGLNIAKGNLIGFVDSDDYIESTMYERLKENMDYYNSDISVCSFYNVKKNCKTHYLKNEIQKKFVSTGKEKYANLHNQYASLTIYSWNKLFKKELFNNIRYPDGRIYEDYYTIYYILDKASSVSYLIEPLYNYVYREDSIVHNFNINHFDKVDSFNDIISFLNKKEYSDLVELEKNKKANTIILNLSKMKLYHINNKEIYEKYYNELVITSKELKWKDSNKYVKRFKIGNKLYLYIRYIEYKTYSFIKTILNRQ